MKMREALEGRARWAGESVCLSGGGNVAVVMGNVFLSEWRQKARSAKVPLQQRSDPCFLMSLKDKDLNFVHLPNHSVAPSVAPL